LRTSFPDIILTNGTVIDGTGAAPILNASVAIQDVLRAWAQEGVTTVRDLGASLRMDQFTKRDRLMQYNRHARLITVGPMITTIGGYGTLKVTTPEHARQEIRSLAKAGADLIKIGIEDHLKVRRHKLISLEEIKAIVETAHACNLRVSAHVTRARHLPLAIDGGVDDVAHMIVDNLPVSQQPAGR
jgi:imidazolonepropionase-like amidohydrolase